MMKKFVLIIFIALFYSPIKAQVLGLDPGTNFLQIGDLDVSGTEITIEAWIKVRQFPTLGDSAAVVSKHFNEADANYILRPTSFGITTYNSGTTGNTNYQEVVLSDSLKLNRWYHIAGVYDGNTVKMYLNGCYKDEETATGNLYQNNIFSAIGNRSGNTNQQFVGNINDVRIWNMARTDTEIKDNLNGLPSSIQPGLVAHYLLDSNAVNNTGNSAFDGNEINSVKYVTDTVPEFTVPEILGLAISNSVCENSDEGQVYIQSIGENVFYDINNSLFRPDSFYLNLFPDTFTINLFNSTRCLYDSKTGIIGFENPIKRTTDFKEICPGDSVFVGGANQNQPGFYDDLYTSVETGCDSVVTTELVLLETTSFLPNAVSICNKDSVIIESELPETKWPDGSTGKTFTVFGEGLIKASATTLGGCSVEDSTNVTFIISEKIFFPTAFTPNKDGKNDFFKPVLNIENIPNYALFIYDSWGGLVFSTQNEQQFWDGTISGSQAPTGAYLYKLEYTPIECIQGKSVNVEIGNLTLVR